MNTTIKTWGDDLVLRIPEKLLAELGLKKGDKVELELSGGKLVIVPIKVGGILVASAVNRESPTPELTSRLEMLPRSEHNRHL